jgi:hypothetical protein
MEVSGQFHAPVALPQAKKPPVGEPDKPQSLSERYEVKKKKKNLFLCLIN